MRQTTYQAIYRRYLEDPAPGARSIASPPRVSPRPRQDRRLAALFGAIAVWFGAFTPVTAQQAEGGAADTARQAEIQFGEMLTKQRCSNCHALQEGEDRYAAPLHNLFGRQPGSIDGNVFSVNMKRIGTPWTPQTLDQWLAQTTFDTPDIRMRHVGIEKADQRAAVIAYLSTLAGNGDTR